VTPRSGGRCAAATPTTTGALLSALHLWRKLFSYGQIRCWPLRRAVPLPAVSSGLPEGSVRAAVMRLVPKRQAVGALSASLLSDVPSCCPTGMQMAVRTMCVACCLL